MDLQIGPADKTGVMGDTIRGNPLDAIAALSRRLPICISECLACVDTAVNPAAKRIGIICHLIVNHLDTGYVTKNPRVDGDAGKHAVIAIGTIDGIVGNNCISAAKKNDSDIGWIGDDVSGDQMGRPGKRYSV